MESQVGAQDGGAVVGLFAPVACVVLPAGIAGKGFRKVEVAVCPLCHHAILHGVVLPPVVRLPAEEPRRYGSPQAVVPLAVAAQRERLGHRGVEEIARAVVVASVVELTAGGRAQGGAQGPVGAPPLRLLLAHQLHVDAHIHVAAQMALAGFLLMGRLYAAHLNILVGVSVPLHRRHPHRQVGAVGPQGNVQFQGYVRRVVAAAAKEMVDSQFGTQVVLHPAVEHLGHGKGIRPEIIGRNKRCRVQCRLVERCLRRCRCGNNRHNEKQQFFHPYSIYDDKDTKIMRQYDTFRTSSRRQRPYKTM